jgi:hypothetical protein
LRYRGQWIDATMMTTLVHGWARYHGRP